MSADGDVERLELSKIAGRSTNWYDHFGKLYPLKLNIHNKLYNPEIPFLYIYKRNACICPPIELYIMFRKALFKITKHWLYISEKIIRLYTKI